MIGFILEIYISQVFAALQFTKLSLNNTNWTIDTLGYICENGQEIDVVKHAYRAKFCASRLLQRMLGFLVGVKEYHKALIIELSGALESMHRVAANPSGFFENISILEKNFREKADFRDQFLH